MSAMVYQIRTTSILDELPNIGMFVGAVKSNNIVDLMILRAIEQLLVF